MSCGTIYDFIDGNTWRMPTRLRAAPDAEEDGRHGVRPMLRPTQDAQALLRDHARLLAQSGCITAS